MPKSDNELEKMVEPTSPKIPEYLVDRLAPHSRHPTVIFGGHLLQIVGAIVILYAILHFLEKYW
jgi:hypothetical protein